MGMGIAVIVVAVLMIALATFFSNRADSDGISKVMFGAVQLMGVMVLLFGCFLIYLAVNHPPHPVD